MTREKTMAQHLADVLTTGNAVTALTTSGQFGCDFPLNQDHDLNRKSVALQLARHVAPGAKFMALPISEELSARIESSGDVIVRRVEDYDMKGAAIVRYDIMTEPQ